MQIRLDGNFKSLSSFVSDELNDFTVITGKNGCGKSQLLEIIKLNSEHALPREVQFHINGNPKDVQVEGIASDDVSVMTKSNLTDKVNQFWKSYTRLHEDDKQFLSYLFQVKPNKKITFTEETVAEMVSSGIVSKEELFKILGSIFYRDIAYELPIQTESQILRHMISKTNREQDNLEVYRFVSEHWKKNITNLLPKDFFLAPIPEKFISSTSVFNTSVDQLFYAWASRRDRNNILYLYKKEYGDINDACSDVEFVKSNPPPWDLLNNLFRNHGIDFYFNGIDRRDFSEYDHIRFRLMKKSNNVEITFSMLSSGEKIIIGLVIRLFVALYFDNDQPKFPDLIILDEPDAHLHPEMSKLLVDILHETFVKKYGIKVIMVTHSPATVALSPDESIYELKNHPVTELKKITKEEGLNILTSRLPTLSIDYQNHKQVFVESPTDVQYYQTIFNKVNSTEGTPFKLYFISNAMGKGNCDQVYSIVNDIRNSGNKTSFGIVDWDAKNSSKNFVLVHGENSRYSIENFICDPIYILTHLISIKAHNVAKDLNRDDGFNEYSVSDFSNEQLQKYVDLFFNRYYEIHKVSQEDKNDLVEWIYYNGKSVQVPQWYTMFQGHDLLHRIKAVFSALEGRYKSEGDLQKTLIHTMAKCYPLIPRDSVQLIKNIILSD